MSREIKFRVFYKPLKLMIQPKDVESINFETKVICVYFYHEGSGYHRLRMSDFELMQFTGLKDDQETEVYQGDKVMVILTGDIYEVVWDDIGCGFLFAPAGDDGTGAIDYYEFEDICSAFGFRVVGSIHDGGER